MTFISLTSNDRLRLLIWVSIDPSTKHINGSVDTDVYCSCVCDSNRIHVPAKSYQTTAQKASWQHRPTWRHVWVELLSEAELSLFSDWDPEFCHLHYHCSCWFSGQGRKPWVLAVDSTRLFCKHCQSLVKERQHTQTQTHTLIHLWIISSWFNKRSLSSYNF